ncbi:MAG: hypothetical protein ACYDBL_08925 [Candidatus Acidiferrales bacterium]
MIYLRFLRFVLVALAMALAYLMDVIHSQIENADGGNPLPHRLQFGIRRSYLVVSLARNSTLTS